MLPYMTIAGYCSTKDATISSVELRDAADTCLALCKSRELQSIPPHYGRDWETEFPTTLIDEVLKGEF